MARTKTITLYQFDELSDKAKEKARDWYREGSAGDNYFAEAVIEDAAIIAGMLGISLDAHKVKLCGGGERSEPNIWWSGFSSQGDGACFEGSYQYLAGAHKAIRAHAPEDTELHRIADGLLAVQRRYAYQVTARVSHVGHYSHEHSTAINVDHEHFRAFPADDDKEIQDLLRAFMKWIYRQLEREYEYQNADAQVDENIRANEYEFDEHGNRED